MKSVILVFLLVTICVVTAQDDKDKEEKFLNDEGRLYRALVNSTHHEPNVRPSREVTGVNFGLSLVSLFGIDEERQTFEIQGWVKKTWNDTRLSWDPAEFSGIYEMRIPHNKIWKPDIVLFNGAFEAGEPSGFGHLYDALAVVYSSGMVLWIPPARIRGTCLLDISNFPFDTQKCHLKFGSWTYSSKHLYLDFYGEKDVEYSYYTESNTWALEDTWAERTDKTYDCCPDDKYTDITFYFKMQRRRSYYSYMLVLPAIVIALLIPVMFLLPVGRPEKFYMGCTLLICLTLLALLMELMVPTAHSGVPFIEAYYLGNFIITGLALAISAAILNISRCRSRPPGALRKIIDVCAKCCCMDTSGANYRSYKVAMNAGSDDNPIVMDVDGAGAGAGGAAQAEWVVIATVLDRFFLCLSVIVAILVTIGMASHT